MSQLSAPTEAVSERERYEETLVQEFIGFFENIKTEIDQSKAVAEGLRGYGKDKNEELDKKETSNAIANAFNARFLKDILKTLDETTLPTVLSELKQYKAAVAKNVVSASSVPLSAPTKRIIAFFYNVALPLQIPNSYSIANGFYQLQLSGGAQTEEQKRARGEQRNFLEQRSPGESYIINKSMSWFKEEQEQIKSGFKAGRPLFAKILREAYAAVLVSGNPDAKARFEAAFDEHVLKDSAWQKTAGLGDHFVYVAPGEDPAYATQALEEAIHNYSNLPEAKEAGPILTLAQAQQKIAALEQSKAQIEAELHAAKESAEGARSEVTVIQRSLGQQIESVTGKKTIAEGKVAELTQNVEALNRQIAELEEKVRLAEGATAQAKIDGAENLKKEKTKIADSLESLIKKGGLLGGDKVDVIALRAYLKSLRE